MDEIRLTGLALLTVMDTSGKLVGFADKVYIRGRIIGLDLFN
jgi:hypothetical protein